MSAQLLYTGRVAVVTGAGGGLGRAYAIEFAKRGASVVVNDLGGDIHGEGKSGRAADNVVNEIRALGGSAIANYDSVEDSTKIIDCALHNFGKVDILVNNAGILRDKTFMRISDNDWDIVHRVHLRGSFLVTRAAWPHMRDNNFGRIIMTSSAAGIYGNFGQANYSAAKLGLLGLSNTLALEGRKHNINCNTIAPMAFSRLSGSVLPPDLVDVLKPEYVAPLVLYLCHESCPESGGLFEVGAGWVGKLRWQGSRGAAVALEGSETRSFTPEDVRDNWEKIVDFDNPRYPTTVQESTGYMLAAAAQGTEEDAFNSAAAPNPKGKALEVIIGLKFPPKEFTYSHRDVILYALGVGMSSKEPDYLNFLYEGSEKFAVLPTFAIVPAQMAFLEVLIGNEIPHVELDPTMILHGEQYTEVHEPLPTAGTMISYVVITDVVDKRTGALIVFDVETLCKVTGRRFATSQFVVYVRGAGKFGGKRNSKHLRPLAKGRPKRHPDAVIEERIGDDQTALYRLSGDFNPLHIDPAFSAMGGYPTPILHGLCTFGYAARHALRAFANNDVSKFKAIKVRFVKPILPGQTLRSEMWREGGRIQMQCTVVETGEACITGAYVDLHLAESESDKAMLALGQQLAADPNLASEARGLFLFKVTKDGDAVKQWTLDTRSQGPGRVVSGSPESVQTADCTLELHDAVLADLLAGRTDPQTAFLSGKLKVSGDLMLAQKLTAVFKRRARL